MKALITGDFHSLPGKTSSEWNEVHQENIRFARNESDAGKG